MACLLLMVSCTAAKHGRRGLLTPDPRMAVQASGTSVLLQAVSVIDENVVWLSGHGGTYVRTTDGGETWHAGAVPGADSLQFRDVHAVDANTAYLLSAGPGELSTIYKTTNAGETWTRQFVNEEPEAFFDCMDFWDPETGMAFSDAVNGGLIIIRTEDGGSHWTHVPDDALPAALDGEGGFAASGTCLVTLGERHAWIGTGAGSAARVLRSSDRGNTWAAYQTPIVSGTSTSGITSLLFRDEMNGLALGGELQNTDGYTDNVANTSDGGVTWVLAGRPQFTGSIYGASLVPGAPEAVVAVGPRGADYSVDNGATWNSLDTLNYWAVGFANPQAGWAVGPEGRISKISLY